MGFPDSSASKECTCNAENPGLIPETGRSPGEGISYSFQYSWASLVTHGKESICNAEDLHLVPGLGRSPGGWPGNPLQYSWRIPMDRGAPQATEHGVKRLRHD